MKEWQPCAIGALPSLFDPNGAIQHHIPMPPVITGIALDGTMIGDGGGTSRRTDAGVEESKTESLEPRDESQAAGFCDELAMPAGSDSGICETSEEAAMLDAPIGDGSGQGVFAPNRVEL